MVLKGLTENGTKCQNGKKKMTLYFMETKKGSMAGTFGYISLEYKTNALSSLPSSTTNCIC